MAPPAGSSPPSACADRKVPAGGVAVVERGPLVHQRMGRGLEPYRTPLRPIRSPRTMVGALENRVVGIPSDGYLAR
jgi:hypothetical protein